MACIHCLLTVKVEWEGVPEHSEGYRFHLDGIGEEVAMHATDRDLVIDNKTHPNAKYSDAGMAEDVPLRRFALQAQLCTLRYTDDNMPSFQLMHGETPVLKQPLSIGEVFSRWDRHPDRDPVQDYELRIVINRNGGITLYPSLAVDVADWQDGGILK